MNVASVLLTILNKLLQNHDELERLKKRMAKLEDVEAELEQDFADVKAKQDETAATLEQNALLITQLQTQVAQGSVNPDTVAAFQALHEKFVALLTPAALPTGTEATGGVIPDNVPADTGSTSVIGG